MLLDYPNAPVSLRIIDTPSSRSVTLAWAVPDGATAPTTDLLNVPVSSYIVQVQNKGSDVEYRDAVAVPDVRTTTADVTGLHPGAKYGIRVLALNVAGATPSRSINITTNSSGKLCLITVHVLY